jgi:hypothetical protein
MIIQSQEATLSDLIRDFKKFTAKSILRKFKIVLKAEEIGCWNALNWQRKSFQKQNYQLWQYGNHPEEVYSNKFMWTKLDYSPESC